jgi:serine/threonine-protein kinase
VTEPLRHRFTPHDPEPEAEDDAPLSLADSSEGSTIPVEGSERPSGETPLESSAAPSASEQSPSPGVTGGFDTMLGKLVVQRGLVSPEEMELCNALARETAGSGDTRALGEILVENQFVTSRQLDRMRAEFEAKRSTEQIPGYKIKKKIGSGAMATVFLARQLSLDRLVAIKVLPKKLSSNASFIERFYKEGRAAAKLNHPHIVGAYDVGKSGDHHYFVMEYVEGETVYDRIVKGRRIEENEALDIVIQAAEALQHAHERGFVHRDIKPKNIMLGQAGVVKLADLGLARAMSDKEAAEAEAGRAYGTPYYISPEQIRGEVNIGPPADIYGLGATLYHMVTGRVPFEGKNPSAVMHKHLKADLVPPDHVNPKLSAACAQVIEMMMAKNPRDRYQRAADLIEDLKLVRAGQPPHFAGSALDLSKVARAMPATPATPLPVASPPPRAMENPAFVAVLAALAVSLLANAVLLLFLLMR